jgi:hypothetical protein
MRNSSRRNSFRKKKLARFVGNFRSPYGSECLPYWPEVGAKLVQLVRLLIFSHHNAPLTLEAQYLIARTNLFKSAQHLILIDICERN